MGVLNTGDSGIVKEFLDKNSMINISLLLTSLYVTFGLGYAWGVFIWVGFILAEDVLYFAFGQNIFDTEIAIQRGYQFGHVFLDNTSGHGRDLGFNLYDGDLQKSYEQSQNDKWKFMMKSLGLKAGDWLIDIGCGYGDWLNYAKSQGVNTVGVNITPEQAEYAKRQWGLDIVCTNWKDILGTPELNKKLVGKFDAVTFMDTIEHYVPGRLRKDIEAQGRIYTDMFKLAHKLMKPQTHCGRIFISCLHQTLRPFGLKERFSAYLLTRYHSGFYPKGDDSLSRWSTEWFKEVERHDRTEDYRITAVRDKNQFQAPKIIWTWNRLIMLPLLFMADPHHLHKWIDIHVDAWMNMYGDDSWDPNYNAEKRRKVSYVRLWWLVLENKSKKVATQSNSDA